MSDYLRVIEDKLSSDTAVPLLAATGVNLSSAKIAQSIFNTTLNKNEINQVNIALNKTCSDINKLTKSDIKITHVSPKNCPKKTKLPNFIESLFNDFISCSKGKNALFNVNKNKVCLNRGKMPLAGFHELGHAYNANSSKFLKGLQYMDPVCVSLAVGFMFLPLLIKKTPESAAKKEDKIKNKIREASPYMAMGVCAPIVAEEGLASLRANKFAKNHLSPKLLKKMNVSNSFSLLTYLSAALMFGIFTKSEV